MNRLEERLTTALRARAELVQPESLRPVGPPRPERRWGRRLGYAVAAAASVSALASLSLIDPGDRNVDPTPGPPSSEHPVSVARTLRGDIDGDGRPDQVHLDANGLLEISSSLFEDSIAHQYLIDVDADSSVELIGLADLDGSELAIVVAVPLTQGIREVEVSRVRRSGPVTFRSSRSLGLVLDANETVWVADSGRLYGGQLAEPLDGGVRVRAFRVVSEGDRLVTKPGGQFCWVRGVEPRPRQCRSPAEFAPDVGSNAGLRRLYPASGADHIRLGGRAWEGDIDGDGDPSDLVQLVSGPGSEARLVVRLSGSGDGGQRSLRQPVAPIRKQAVQLSVGPGFVSFRSDIASVFAVVDGRLRGAELPVDEIGIADRSQIETWQAADGGLYSRVGLDELRYRVWQWDWRAGESLPTPTDLGEVCIDEGGYDVRFGRC